MSYILNALRKSERQRIQSQPETLEKSILEKNEPQQKKISLWLIVLIIMNMVFLGFIIWSFAKEDKHEVSSKVATTIKSVEKSASVVKDSEPIARPARIKTKKPQLQNSIAEQIKQQKSKVKRVNTKPDKIKLAIKANKAIEKPKNLLPVIKKPATAVESIKTSDSAEKAATKHIPFLKELAYGFFREVPEVDINVFVYTENKNERFIMVEMKKYIIEEQILPGMILKEIREKSIVVEYKAKVFQIKRN